MNYIAFFNVSKPKYTEIGTGSHAPGMMTVKELNLFAQGSCSEPRRCPMLWMQRLLGTLEGTWTTAATLMFLSRMFLLIPMIWGRSQTMIRTWKTLIIIDRFPWLAFYTSTFVRAGQELCWDSGYEVGSYHTSFFIHFTSKVGSIADKEIYCSCGSFNCRGRLL